MGSRPRASLPSERRARLRAIVRTAGRAAHSAYPELGRSATRALVQLLADLDTLSLPTDPVLGATTINIGALSGGVADNVVAPSAEARLMIRLVGQAGDVEERLRRWVEARGTIEFGAVVPPVRLRTAPGFETGVVAFATDIPCLTNWGEPYLFGPGSIHHAHTDGEYVDVEELVRAVDAYERLALHAVAAAQPRE